MITRRGAIFRRAPGRDSAGTGVQVGQSACAAPGGADGVRRRALAPWTFTPARVCLAPRGFVYPRAGLFNIDTNGSFAAALGHDCDGAGADTGVRDRRLRGD